MPAGFIGLIVPIPIGHGGLVGTRDQAEIGPENLIVARNLSLFGGTVSKEGGATKYNSSAITGTPTILGGWDWWPTSGVQRMVVFCSDGNMYKDTGGGSFSVTLGTGFTVSDVVPVFVEGGKEAAAGSRKLFCFTGVNAPQVLAADGATVAALATPAADWGGANQPTFGLNHEGRLWAGGNANDPHRLYYSMTSNHEDMTGAGSGSISVFPGEGEKLVGAVSFKGIIIAWKFPRGVYLINTTDPTSSNWKVQRLSSSVGGAGPLAGVIVDNDFLLMDSSANLHLLSAVQEFGDVGASDLSRKGNFYTFLSDNLNRARLPFVRAVYYAAKREAHFAAAGAGSSVNSVRVVVDFNREGTVRFRYSDRDTPESLWLRKDTSNVPRMVHGDNAGFVWLMDSTVKSKDGAGYAGSFQTPYMDFGWVDPRLGTQRKIGQFLEVVVAPTGNWNLSVDILWDGTTVQTVTFNMGVTGAALGSFVLGTDKLAGDQILNRKRRIVGSGRRLSLAGTNSGAGEDFSIGHMYAHLLVSDERVGRDASV